MNKIIDFIETNYGISFGELKSLKEDKQIEVFSKTLNKRISIKVFSDSKIYLNEVNILKKLDESSLVEAKKIGLVYLLIKEYKAYKDIISIDINNAYKVGSLLASSHLDLCSLDLSIKQEDSSSIFPRLIEMLDKLKDISIYTRLVSVYDKLLITKAIIDEEYKYLPKTNIYNSLTIKNIKSYENNLIITNNSDIIFDNQFLDLINLMVNEELDNVTKKLVISGYTETLNIEAPSKLFLSALSFYCELSKYVSLYEKDSDFLRKESLYVTSDILNFLEVVDNKNHY